MKCPFCSNEDSQVIESRQSEIYGTPSTRRRRTCLNPKCGKRYTSYEITATVISQIEAEIAEARRVIGLWTEGLGLYDKLSDSPPRPEISRRGMVPQVIQDIELRKSLAVRPLLAKIQGAVQELTGIIEGDSSE